MFGQSNSNLFIILVNNDTIYAEYSLKYKNPPFKSPFLNVDKDLKIDVATVKAYQNEDGYFKKFNYGYTQPTFYERVLKGNRIEGYSKIVVTQSYTPNPYGGGFYNSSSQKLYYYSKDGRQLEKMNIRNLERDLKDNPASLLELKKAKSKDYISAGFYIAGAAMIIASIASMDVAGSGDPSSSYGPKIPPLLIIGGATLSIPWFIRSGKINNMTNAIQMYNN